MQAPLKLIGILLLIPLSGFCGGNGSSASAPAATSSTAASSSTSSTDPYYNLGSKFFQPDPVDQSTSASDGVYGPYLIADDPSIPSNNPTAAASSAASTGDFTMTQSFTKANDWTMPDSDTPAFNTNTDFTTTVTSGSHPVTVVIGYSIGPLRWLFMILGAIAIFIGVIGLIKSGDWGQFMSKFAGWCILSGLTAVIVFFV